MSTYYSSNCDKSDAEFVQGFLKEKVHVDKIFV